jgi:hypothetical protein
MQTLVETLNLYNNAFDALCEAHSLVEQLEKETGRILDNNEEPITAHVVGRTPRTFTTPTSLDRLSLGTIISVGGVEYMRTGYSGSPWIDCLGHEHSHREMFRRMLEHVGECDIIHVGN